MPKYLTQGTYGCVFNPPFKCKNSANIADQNFVGKVFKDFDDGNAEWKETRVIEKIDPDGALFIYPMKKCDVDYKTLASSSDYSKCNFISPSVNDYLQLISKNGGMQLGDYISLLAQTEKLTCANLIYITSYLFYGIKKLLKAGYIHQDLKPANIVMSENGIRMIDFGLITHKDQFYSKQNFIFWDNIQYHVNPPEYRLVHFDNINDPNFTRSEQSNVENVLGFRSLVFDKTTFKQNMDAFKAILLKESNRIAFLKSKKVHEKSDIFSLGLIIKLFMGNKNLMIPKNQEKKHTLKLVEDMVDKMTNPNPFERVDINTLLKMVREIKHSATFTFKKPFSILKNIDEGLFKEFWDRVETKSVRKDSKTIDSPKKIAKKVCKPGYSINPKTGKCIKDCPPGSVRNLDTGRCNKIKNAKDLIKGSPKSKIEENKCQPGYSINPKTGKCIKDCPPGSVRNLDTGRCNKIKNAKKA